jgi:hypothetical protein
MTEHSSKESLLANAIKIQIADPGNTNRVDPLTREQIYDLQQDRALKKTYAKWFIGILIGQLVIMNLVFLATGMDYLHFEQWGLNLYMGGTLLEVFGIVLVITKNLFPQKGK